MTDHRIQGKTVIIAGGAKNLGGLIARDLASHGARAIAIHYNSSATKAEPTQPWWRSRLPAPRRLPFRRT